MKKTLENVLATSEKFMGSQNERSKIQDKLICQVVKVSGKLKTKLINQIFFLYKPQTIKI